MKSRRLATLALTLSFISATSGFAVAYEERPREEPTQQEIDQARSEAVQNAVALAGGLLIIYALGKALTGASSTPKQSRRSFVR